VLVPANKPKNESKVNGMLFRCFSKTLHVKHTWKCNSEPQSF
jgi:hypothetical protein